VDFDPGPRVDERTSAWRRCFVTHFSADGAYEWTQTFGEGDWTSYVSPHDLGVTPQGYVIVVGSFTGTAEFAPVEEHTSAGQDDVFITMLDAAGAHWGTRRIGGSGNDSARSLVATADSGVVIVGGFSDRVDFDPNAGYVYGDAAGAYDGYVLRLDRWRQIEWVGTFGGLGSDWGWDVAELADGSLAVVGSCEGTPDLDLTEQTLMRATEGESDACILVAESDASTRWAMTFGGDGSDAATEVAASPDGRLFVGGWFDGEAVLGTGEGDFARTSAGGLDAFLTRLTVP
jgi:hypothetical protein